MDEPVACIVDGEVYLADEIDWEELGGTPLYAAPPRKEWVGLTDAEIDELHGSPMSLEHSGELKWVRIIEARLKDKNNAV